jgi:spermidine synthase
MGATFPIAADWLSKRGRESFSTGGDAAALYAANTAGAAAGAVAAGFWLIPALGLRGTTWVGVGLNLIAAAGALWITTFNAEPAELAERIPSQTKNIPEPSLKRGSLSSRASRAAKREALRVPRALRLTASSSPRLACAAVAISGAAALAYEVAWTRLLALVIGPTTYAFATMAAAFITGLAIGSAAAAGVSRRTPRPAIWLGVMLVAGAVASMAAAWYAATRLPLIVAAQVADPNVIFSHVVAAQALGVALLLLPTTVALGATFPFALAVAGHASTVGRDTARVYAANTLGAIVGALAAGFVLIPQLGLRSTFQTAAILSVLGGACCLLIALSELPRAINSSSLFSGFRGRSLLPAAIATASLVTIVALPGWDRELLASGAYKYAPYLQSADRDLILRAGTLEYYNEGAAGTVSVRRLTGTRSLAIDGKVDASNGGDMLTQRLLGLLPVLIHGNARDIAVIGLGSGVTVGSALAPGTVQHADVVEISPEVVEASHYFDDESGRVLAQPAVRLIVGDGRSHLLLTPRHYDVIVSEPSNPWMAGVASLFTREFFEAARARLSPHGLLCQWAHTYDISADDLQSIVRTFAAVFPQGTMWLVGEGDLLLIGANDGALDARLAAIAAGCRKGTTPATLATLGIDSAAAPFSLLSLYAGGPREMERYAGQAALQTDDRMALEYSAPRGIYGRTVSQNGIAIRALLGEQPAVVRTAIDVATDADWTSRGVMLLRAEAFGLAYDAFRRALAINSSNIAALTGLSDAAAGFHREQDERLWLTTIAGREPANAAVRVELARLMASAGEFEPALNAAEEALRITPDDPRAAEQVASILADAGDAERLTQLADRLVERFPDRTEPRYYRATALFLRGRTDDALAAIEPVVNAHPEHARAQNLLGAACATLGRRDCAQAAFQASLRANPRDSSTYVNLAMFHLQNGNAEAASAYFAEALALDPASESARNGLAQSRVRLDANPQ